jgi:hypothetical protein
LLFVLGVTPNNIPLKYRCPIKKSDRMRHVYLKKSGHTEGPYVQ